MNQRIGIACLLCISALAAVWLHTAKNRAYHSRGTVRVEYLGVRSAAQIRPVRRLVKPIIYTQVISLQGLPVAEQKKKFIDLMLPAVLLAKFKLEDKYARVQYLIEYSRQKQRWSADDSTFVQTELRRYQASTLQQLALKVKPHPVSLVLAQAAMESGWGTSGFFVKANNVFGMWSFSEEEDRIETTARRGSHKVYLRRYDNISLAIEDYYETIGRVPAYQGFRKKRLNSNNPYQLLPQLHAYSELGKQYTRRLRAVIQDNQLIQYDSYRLAPAFIEKEPSWLVAGLR